MFFAQNAGAKAAGTGLNKSSVIQKISLPEAMAVSHLRSAVGQVQVTVVDFDPPVINPNGIVSPSTKHMTYPVEATLLKLTAEAHRWDKLQG